MARHRQIEAAPDEDPAMDISSLIDCCFLLLIYFLVATTLVREAKLDIAIPGDPNAATKERPPLEPGRISVRADGTVFWNGDQPAGEPYDPTIDSRSPSYHEQRRLPQLVDFLKLLKDQADTTGTTPIVMLLADAETPHQRIMDVMAALAEANIHSVGMNVNPKE